MTGFHCGLDSVEFPEEWHLNVIRIEWLHMYIHYF